MMMSLTHETKPFFDGVTQVDQDYTQYMLIFDRGFWIVCFVYLKSLTHTKLTVAMAPMVSASVLPCRSQTN